MIHGIDYYSGNGSPSLSGLQFAFIKATEGLHGTDPAYAAQRARIKQAGLAFGAYHFGWQNESVGDQAQHFVDVAKPAAGDMLFIDFEGYPDGRNWSGMSWAARDAWRLAWIHLVKSLTKGACRVGTYINTSDWHQLPSNDPGDFLFIAEYGASRPDITHAWQFWQHTSNPLDQDYGDFASRAALDTWRLSAGTTAHTDSVEDDMTPAQAAQLAKIEAAVTDHGIASAGYRLLKDGKSAEAGGATDVHQVWNDTAEGVTSLLKQVSALAGQVKALTGQVATLTKQVGALTAAKDTTAS